MLGDRQVKRLEKRFVIEGKASEIAQSWTPMSLIFSQGRFGQGEASAPKYDAMVLSCAQASSPIPPLRAELEGLRQSRSFPPGICPLYQDP